MYMSPMLLDRSERPFNDDRYIFEPKVDGIRAILSRSKGETRIWTPDRTEITMNFPELWYPQVSMEDIVLDGEIVCLNDEQETFNYDAVKNRLPLTTRGQVQAAAKKHPVTYIAWDILYKGKDLTAVPLVRRKSILESVLLPDNSFMLMPYVQGNGEGLFAEMCKRNWEGTVAKSLNSPYVTGRRPNRHWIQTNRYELVSSF